MTKKKEKSELKKVGAKPLHTPESLHEAIERYFDNPPFRITGGSEIPFISITGLVLSCGFSDRQSFYDYQNKPEFSCIIKRARLMVENEYEYKLQQNNPTGAIFALKNMNWKDTQVVQNENKDVKTFGDMYGES
jgi:MoaA/NifB/PqqE/SkfB family radical SAM enzyme